MALLKVDDLVMYYRTRKGTVKAVDHVSFEIEKGETLAIVGESGCGKSSLSRAIIRLLPRNVEVYEGKVFLNGTNIMELGEEQFRKEVRWRKISMVFQGALNALNPVLKVGEQVAEPLVIHMGMDKKEALNEARKMIKQVGIAEAFVDRYPFELSGGMRQRIVIAMALITDPDLVILDEPTSALDVITQANVMNLLKRLKKERDLTYIFITHDIALASELADKMATMYAGQIIELADSESYFGKPLHPYTQKLLGSVPTLREDKEIISIPGTPPNLLNPPVGCRFRPRCDKAMEICEEEPPMFNLDGHRVKCWLYRGEE
ncbi:MAG: ABC transporter ATP-binding protein [Candidatus Korarchaeota archaeon]|nr:ABC transporter ATP-binding protein [Candidatus Korarchaeota archaeon]